MSYLAPAQLSATSVEADFGALGEVSLAVAPSAREGKLRSNCGKGRAVAYDPPRYSGSFEFHGEEGYTDAVSTAPRDYTRLFAGLVCPGIGSGEIRGGDLPGARLLLRSRQGRARLQLRANENHPGGRSRFEIEVREKRGAIGISRTTTVWLHAEAFRFDPRLRMATLDPPMPFSGQARFHRSAGPALRWTGNLAVDLPGRSNFPLVGPGITATLTHACWQGEGAGTRADCGFR